MAYSEALLARFMDPQYARTVPVEREEQQLFYSVLVGSQEQGALLALYVQAYAQTQLINDAGFQMYGCGACIATADILCERLIGLNLNQLQSFTTQELAVELKLPMVKMHCTWLANEALEKITTAWQLDCVSHS